ncbi:hypothetical protein IFM51744_05288 [Aspergillus udagawae]|uniref:Ecp2 effector protein-like domain-containing protein n=1 Tax=Aspergillus udagawae TaxID=91492 RepID=A0ABQ1ANE9_9EURO|nr:hypothetical protein IFM51744_05288 [Aspergillus udagawae]GFF83390.1 hypothetical protein IFM53868_03789 [Aspergillus udagawae]
MQLLKSITALGLFLTAAVEAAPVTADRSMNETSPSVLFIKKRASINDCGASTFINQSSGGSPRVDDCLQIARNIAGGGTWVVSAIVGDHHQLLQYGTCAFGVEVAPGWSEMPIYKVGNQDIIDLINDSVNRFQWYGLVGAKGVMDCQRTLGSDTTPVQWGIYHT